MKPIEPSSSPSSRKFLIVYCQPTFWSMGKGSGAGSFWRTPSALASRGHEVHIVQPAPPQEPGGRDVADGVHLHRYPATLDFMPPPHAPLPARLAQRFISYWAYQRIGTRTALAVARDVRPDLVLGYGQSEAPVARRVARAMGVPNVTRIFGTALALTLGSPIRFWLHFPEVIAFRTPCARLILTNDGADGDKVAEKCGVPPERFVHLRNGLDFTGFSPGPGNPDIRRRIDVARDAPLLLTVTRLATEKKLERVISALPAILTRVPKAVAVLLGEGPERAALEATARRLGVERAVRMPGAVLNRDLPEWYRSATVVLSLLDRTNASNPVFEAMACGRCVLALDAGTTREIVIPDRTGVLVGRKDLQRLGEILVCLLLDPARMERLGNAGRAHIRRLLLDPNQRMDQEIGILLDVIREAEAR